MSCIPVRVTVDTNSAEDYLFLGFLERFQEEAEKKKGEAPPFRLERERLDVGDVRFVCGEEKEEKKELVFERKTWTDLAASICDGRMTDQKKRALLSEQELPSSFFYLVEGDILSWTEAIGRMSGKAMWCSLIKSCLRDGCPVFHTKEKGDSVLFLLYVLDQLRKGAFSSSSSSHISDPNVKKRKRDNLSDKTSLLRSMLCSIPGMSPQKASSILEKYPSLPLLLSANRKEVEDITCNGRRIGKSLSDRVFLALE